MKTKLNWLLTFVLTLVMPFAFAQAQTIEISGTVSDGDGLPLPGVNIQVQETSEGTTTDFDGNYTLEAEEGQVLLFSSVGFQDQEITVGSDTTIDVTMEEGSILDEVVVTALGITRDEKALGYSAQKVSGADLSSSRVSNPLNALSGNVAGAQITNPSSNLGGSTRILLRGVTSLTGENRPLIVIDGTPMSNQNYNTSDAQRGAGGRDFGDMAFDINPDDIEDINVLKGGPAAALYGSRGANGVIMITTKHPEKGQESVVVNSGISVESISVFPKMQKQYGGGSGDFKTININGADYEVADFGVDESWGPKYDPNRLVLQWNNFDEEEFPDDYLNPQPWMYPKKDMKTFFRDAVTTTNSVSVNKSYENTSARVSLSHVDQEGIVPNSNLTKTTAALSLETKINDKLTASGDLTYVRTDGFNRPEVGYGDNSVAQKFFQWGQRQLDYGKLRDYKLADGSQRTWNRTAWDDARPEFADNPYWTVYENTAKDKRNRFYGNVNFKYDILEGLYATAAINGDHYDLDVRSQVAIGSQGESEFNLDRYGFTEMNYEGRLHFDKKWDEFSLNSFVGVNRMHQTTDAMQGHTNGGLVATGIYNLGNSMEEASIINNDTRKRINSVFGGASLGWRDMVYVDFSGRNDWSSTLPSSDNSYFYPAVTGSFIFSEVIDNADWLTYGKLRAGYSQVRNDTDPYQLINTYNNSSLSSVFLGVPGFTNSNTKSNEFLKPEIVSTWEVGIEAAFLKRRVEVDLTYYNKETEDLIMPVEISPSSGYSYKIMNAGKMENKGIEALVSVIPVQLDDFDWKMSVNFSKNQNKVVDLYEDLDAVVLGNAPFNVSVAAMRGEEYGQIRGTDFVYDDDGNKVVDENGLYLSTAVKNLGSILPDYNMGIRNVFTYKNLSLSALIDIQQGGKYFSTSHMWGHYSGMLAATAADGVREDGLVVPGVTGDVTFNSDGSYTVDNTAENTTVTDAHDHFADYYTGPDAQNVFDASYVKLREITLSYDFPKDITGPFAGIRLTAFARNLASWGLDNKDFDPEMASTGSGNLQGIEGGNLPATRTYGMNLQLKF